MHLDLDNTIPANSSNFPYFRKVVIQEIGFLLQKQLKGNVSERVVTSQLAELFSNAMNGTGIYDVVTHCDVEIFLIIGNESSLS